MIIWLQVNMDSMIAFIDKLSGSSTWLATFAWVTLLTSCATVTSYAPAGKGMPKLNKTDYISYDNKALGYRKWLPASAGEREPAIVIIGVHGISGHAGDYHNLGSYLTKQRQDVAVYAAETRGQGMEQKESRRGDIRRVRQWYDDLYTFTELVRELHPQSKIVWFGESMGSLIVMHAYHDAAPVQRPHGIVISSPIIEVDSELPGWKLAAAKLAAIIFPKARISLESLSDGRNQAVTKQDIHEQQAAKNPWYIRRYTLRLLIKLGDMAQAMDQAASSVYCPVLLLHAGKDCFTQEEKVNDFYEHFDQAISKSHHYYPESYHLLMYDHQRDKIFSDISSWLGQLTSDQSPDK